MYSIRRQLLVTEIDDDHGTGKETSMRASGYYPTPIHGVSTMPSSTVLYGYARLQENFRSDPVEKLKLRPSLYWEAAFLLDSAEVVRHIYTRNEKEYTVFVDTDGRVTGMIDGVVQETEGDASKYISGVTKQDIDMVTINDTVFILNRSKEVKLLDKTDESEGNVKKVSYLNVVTALNYSETATVDVKRYGSVIGSVSYSIPALGTTSPNYDAADKARATDAVAKGLYDKLVVLGKENGFECWVKGSNVGVAPTDGKGLTLEVASGQGVESLVAINNTVEKTAGFPLYALVDSVVTVKPDPSKDKGTYYLRAVRIAEEVYEGMEEVVWAETRKPTEKYALDEDTMPYTVTFEDGKCKVSAPVLGWSERRTGDNVSVKVPKCVGSTIKRLGYLQTRLVLLTGSNAIMSETDNLYDLWKASSIKLLKTDTISIASNATDIDVLEHMVPHNKDMLITAANAQFKIAGDTALTPETASMYLTTSIEVDTLAKPVPMGSSVFFPTRQRSHAGITEYTGQKNTQQDMGLSITDHITGYLKGRITKIVANSTNEMLVAITTDARKNEVFVYEQFTNEKGQKVQKAWSSWVFPDNLNIQDIHLEFNKLSIMSVENGIVLQYYVYIDSKIASGATDEIFLDYKLEEVTDGLTLDLPEHFAFDTDLIIVQGDGCINPLYKAAFTYDAYHHRILFDSDISLENTCTVHIGKEFVGSYQPNRPYRRGKDGRVLTEEKIRIATVFLEVSASFDMTIETTSEVYGASKMEYTNAVVGVTKSGTHVPFTGVHEYPFLKDADLANVLIKTKGYLGVTITGMRWRGQYTQVSTIV